MDIKGPFPFIFVKETCPIKSVFQKQRSKGKKGISNSAYRRHDDATLRTLVILKLKMKIWKRPTDTRSSQTQNENMEEASHPPRKFSLNLKNFQCVSCFELDIRKISSDLNLSSTLLRV